MSQEPLVTAFKELNTAEKTSIIELNNSLPKSDFRDEEDTSGSASVTDTDSEFQVTHSTAGDFARFTSSSRGRYVPGKIAEAGIGIRAGSSLPTSGDYTAKWGYFEMDPNNSETIENGALFGHDSQGFFLEVIRAQDSNIIRPGDFNEVRSTNIDFTQGHIFQIQFGYYGYLPIRFQYLDKKYLGSEDEESKTVNLHTHIPEQETSLTNTNLKVGTVIDSSTGTGSFDLFVGGRQFNIIGEFRPRTRKTNASVNNVNVADADDWVPVLSFKKKQSFREIPVDYNTTIVRSNQNVAVRILRQPTLDQSTFGSIDRIPDSETAVEKDTSATSTSNGRKVDEFLVDGGKSNNSAGQAFKDVTLPVDLVDEGIFTIEVNADGSDATVDAVASVIEQW